jgi:hypothetical protein
MLSCVSCESALAILPIPSLSTTVMEKLCQAYRKKIVTHHQEDCPFGWQQSQWERLQEQEGQISSTRTVFVVPPYMASVIPATSVQLMEHPTPSKLVKERIQDIQQALLQLPSPTASTMTTATKTAMWKFPRLLQDVPTEILQCFDSISTNHSMKSLLAMDSDEDDQSMIIFSLVILGWIPITPQKKRTIHSWRSPMVFSLGCPLCLARIELELDPTTFTNTNTRTGYHHINAKPTKRPRIQQQLQLQLQQQHQQQQRHCDNNNTHPLDAHRYYCPYRCGFPVSLLTTPSSTPVWKRILDRLCQEQEKKKQDTITAVTTSTTMMTPTPTILTDEKEKSMDQSIDKVRRILRAGILQTTVDIL